MRLFNCHCETRLRRIEFMELGEGNSTNPSNSTNRYQRGFTFMEILIVMAVGGMLLSGILLAIFQSFGITKASSTQITALENVKSAAYWIVQDIKKAGTTNVADGGGAETSLTLDWTIWYDSNPNPNLITYGEYHRIKYFLSGSGLLRQDGTYSPSSTPTLPISDGSFTWQADRTVARYISSAQFSRQGNMITVTITSSPLGDAQTAERKTYYVYLQPKEDPVQ